MPLHLGSLHGNNVLFHKDESGRKWFCNVSTRDSPWKMRRGICGCEGLLGFRRGMALCLILVGLQCLLTLTMRNIQREFWNLYIVRFYFKPGSMFIWQVPILGLDCLSQVKYGMAGTDQNFGDFLPSVLIS